MSEKEKKSREMLEQLARLPPKTQERIGYIIEPQDIVGTADRSHRDSGV